MEQKKLKMKLLKNTYSVCRLENTNSIPKWAMEGDFYSITKTEDELSVVCLQKSVPLNIKCEKDWRILKVEGPLDFSLVGILASISSLMAEKNISIFAISTYDTDYILVKNRDLDKAIDSLRNDKYDVL